MRLSLKTVALTVLLLVVAGLMYVRAEEPDALQSKPAPTLTLSTLNGGSVDLASQKGKVVLLDFWATWCPPCVASLPHLQKLSADKSLAEKGLVVWGVNCAEDSPDVKTFVTGNKYTFAVPMAMTADIGRWDAGGIPRVFLVGRDGIIKKGWMGLTDTTEKEIDDAVQAVLQESAAQ